MKFLLTQQNTLRNILLTLCVSTLFLSLPFAATAQFNPEINYQGKLTNAAGVAVPDGLYNMNFWLVPTDVGATSTAVWSEVRTSGNRVEVVNGLFSVMLGDVSSLSSVDFNQTLYLGVEIGGISTTTPAWDGEMSPRKILGAVPAAFVAETAGSADTLSGVASSSFLRSDEADTMQATSSSPILSIIQNGAGAVARFFSGVTEVFTILGNGNVGVGTSTPSTRFTVAGDARITGTSTLATTSISSLSLGTALTAVNGGTGLSSVTQNQLLIGGAGNTWTQVATSSLGLGNNTFLGLTDTPGSYTANRIVFTNSGATALTDSASFVFTGTNLGIGSTTPSSRLTVQGVSGSASDTFRVASSTGSTTLALLANGDLELPGQFISAGIEWSPVNSVLPNFLNSITYGNGVFVAVSINTQIVYSDNGVTWATTSVPSGVRNSVTYGNGLFVAVGSSGDRVITSPDGITWTVRSAAGNDDSWREVTYGNGLFVAVGSSGDRVMTSPDGINWTVRSAVGNDDEWNGVTYGNGLFVAVGGSGDRVMTSPDGINWTARSAAGNDDRWSSVTYGNGLFVAVASSFGSVEKVITSPDGITWTSRSAVGNDDDWNSVTYGNGLFVAVGYYGDSIMTSPDGINWTGRDAYGYWQSVAYGNGLFVAVAYDATTPRAMVSGKINTTQLATKNIFQGGLSVFDTLRVGTTTTASSLFVQSVAGLTPFTVASSTGASMLTLSQLGNFGIGSSSPSSLLTVSGNTYIGGDLRLTGALRDGANATGTLGMMLQSTGTSTRWVATSTLGIGGTFLGLSDTPSSYTANALIFTDSGATGLTDSADLTYDGNTLILGTGKGIGFGGTGNILYAIPADFNYFFGTDAGTNNSGTNIVAIGRQAGFYNGGSYNVLLGDQAGRNNYGSYNNIIGELAGEFSDGVYNNIIGSRAGTNNRGDYSNLFGANAGYNNEGSFNEFFGFETGYYSELGSSSIAIGSFALRGTTDYNADNNVAIGYGAGSIVESGASNNILLGYQAADNLTTGANNLVIGYDVDIASSTGSNQLNIGNLIFGTGLDGTGTTLASGNVGIGTSTPGSKLTVAGDLRLTGALRDGANASGTLGMILQTTGTSTRWVATSTLGFTSGATTFLALTDTPSSYTANRIFYTNSGATAVVDSADFTYDGTNLGLGGDDGITIGGLRAFSASTSIGNYNIGWLAGDSETTGTYNMLLGQMAGRVIADGSFNNAIGGFSLRNLVSGTSNNAIGYSAGFNLTSGSANSIFGDFAGNQLVGGNDNSFFGARAGEYAATSSDSVAFGAYSAQGVSGYTASRFTVLGYAAGENMATGADNNILLGYRAADNLTTGNNNIIIGYDIDNVTATTDNALNIGNLIFGTGLDGTGTTLASGNVGIGTTSPSAKLDVWGGFRVGTSSTPILSVSSALRSVSIKSNKTDADLNIGSGTGGAESIPTFVMYSPIDSGAGQDYGDSSALFRIDSISQGGGYFGGGANLQGISASNSTAGLLLSGYQRTTGTVTVPTVVISGSKWNGASATASLTGNDVVLGIASSGNSSGDIATFMANGNVGFGTTTPASRLSVAGDLRLTGAFRDGANASGTLGMILQTTGTSTRWVATSTLGFGGASTFLGLTDTPSSYTANRVFYTNAGASAVTDSANFTFDGTNLGLGAQSRIGFGGTNYLYASSTNDSIVFGENAGATFTNNTTFNVAIGYEAGRYASSTNVDSSIFIGSQAGRNSTSTFFGSNTFIGSDAGRSNIGGQNTFLGDGAGEFNNGNFGIFLGSLSGQSNIGSYSNLFGAETGRNNTGYGINAIGYNAGYNNTAEYLNAIGWLAAVNNTGSSSNIFGYQAGYSNTGSSTNILGRFAGYSNDGDYVNLFGENAGRDNQGDYVDAIGALSGYVNSGDYSNFMGYGAGYSNAADYTTAIGYQALGTTTASSTGISNIAIGYRSLFNNTTGGYNTALGYATLLSNTEGANNTAIGTEALRSNTTGGANTAMGQGALFANTTGSNNTALGQSAMFNNTTGFQNVAVGAQTLQNNSSGRNNTALGWGALGNNTIGIENTAVGFNSGTNISSGNFNTLLGYRAGENITTGGQNIVIGYDLDISTSTASNQLNIGNLLFGTGVDGTGTTLSSGNIGIGTTSPLAKLDVWGGFNVGTSSRSLISASTSANQVAFGTGSVVNDAFGNTPLVVLSGNGATLRPTLYLNEESTDAFSGGRISFGRSSLGGDRLIGALDFHNAAEISAVTDIGDEYAGSIRFATNEPGAGPALSEHMRLTSTGNLGLGTTTPSSKLTVAGDLRLTGAFRDGANASGTLGMVLQSTGTSTRWVATSTLGISGGGASTFLALTDTPSSYTANRVLFTNGAATALIDSADFTFDGTNLGLGNGDGIAFGGARMFAASTSGSIALGFNAGYYPADDNFIAIGREAALNAGSSDRNIALGYRAARDLQAGSNFNVFVGYEAGATSTGARNIMLGLVSGAESVGDNNNFIGSDAGRLSQGSLNNFLGSGAGIHNSGASNNFIGLEAGNFNVGTSSNIIGNRAGLTNSGSSTNLFGTFTGYANTGDYVDAIGAFAGYANTGDYNSFMGYSAGATTTGSYNLSLGYLAAASSSGSMNNIFGRNAGLFNRGSENNIFGWDAGRSNTGSFNNFFGTDAGNSNSGGSNNFFGIGAGYANSGSNNNFFGYDTGWLNNGNSNEMIGSETGRNVQGSFSVLIGAQAYRGGAGFDPFSATNNVAIGYRAGYNATTSADNNILLGYRAADNLTTGNNNIIIGYDIDNVTATADNRLNIGNLIFGTGLDGTGTTLSSGNIGIGTSTPGSKLSVAGDLRVTGAFRDGANASGTLGMVLQSTGTSTRWVATSTLGISGGGGGSLFTDGGATTYLTATGDNLAIGTTTASSRLTVDGDISVFGDINLQNDTVLTVAGQSYIHGYTLDNTYGVNQFMGYQAGNFALGSSTNQFFGIDNIGIGRVALSSLTEGSNNTAVGHMSLTSLTSGFANTAVGTRTLVNTTTGGDNNAFGNDSLYNNITGYRNVALGNSAMYENETGDSNVAIGFRSLFNSVSGSSNVAVGAEALYSAIATGNNTGVGHFALRLATGDNNTAFGAYAGSEVTSGTNNTILGNYTGFGLSTGSNNTIIGANVSGLSSGLSNNIIIADGQGNRRINVNAIGNVGIGTTTPFARLALENLNFSSTTGAAGIDQYFSFNNSVADATIYGNRAYLYATNTATTTLIGSILRVADSTTFGNTIRGLEVQADNGNNTRGENTGIAAFGRTFGVRGTTVGDAGGTFEPAGIYGETEGTTQGNAIRGYSSSITTAALLKLFQDTSAFTGTGLLMNFGNAGGSFSSTTASRFIDLQNAGTSRFTVGAYGMTTIGDGTTVNNAGLQIGYGGICVDNDGSCNASTTGRISAVSYHTGNSDLAETYFSSENLKTGEVVYLKGELSIGRASEATEEKVIGVVTTKPGLLLGFDDESLRAGEEVYGVALAGRVPVRLSNENGEIKAGDELMLSSIPGVAMKASSTGTVVGIALEDFEENRAYSDTYINQFGDDLVDPVVTPINPNSDPRVNDGCYYGAGNASGDAPCVPLVGTTTDAQVAEAQALAEAEAQAAALEALKDVRSETVTLENGETVRVGQVVMFVSLDKRYLDEDGIAMVAALLASGEGADADAEVADTVWSRLVTLANNFVDGVLSVFTLKADRIEVTEELCVDGVCLNADDIRQLLDGTTSTTPAPEETEVIEEEDEGSEDEPVPPIEEPEGETGSSTEEVIEETESEEEGGGEEEVVPSTGGEVAEPEVEEEPADEPEETEEESGASTPAEGSEEPTI